MPSAFPYVSPPPATFCEFAEVKPDVALALNDCGVLRGVLLRINFVARRLFLYTEILNNGVVTFIRHVFPLL
jgi:hypothetical protein